MPYQHLNHNFILDKNHKRKKKSLEFNANFSKDNVDDQTVFPDEITFS